MTLKYIKFAVLLLPVFMVAACSSSSGSTSAGTRVTISSTASPVNTLTQSTGAKTFNNDLGDTITLTRAYLVLASATIETSCGPNFSAVLEGVLNFIIPAAVAHTTSTPTSTGEPHVIDMLDADGATLDIGSLSPPAEEYCGVDIDMLAADSDASNLPTAAGEPDMVGKTLHLEGSYQLAGGATGSFTVSTGASLASRKILLATLMAISGNNLNGTIIIGINYDTWFNAIDLAALETETATLTNPLDPQVNQLLQNISASLHQL